MTPSSPQANAAQSTHWNVRAGAIWVEQQLLLDRLLLPFEQRLTDIVGASGARDVLDIGCGAGATTTAVGWRLAGRGQCTGLDISAPLIEAARRRAEADGLSNVSFILADAQQHPFEPERFDAVISRFGVMFFDDPEAAFANLRRAVRTGADLTFIAWRVAKENPFMVAAERAAAPFLPEAPAPDPDGPGQFAFADPDRMRRFLASGWRDIDIQALDVPCTLPEPDLTTYVTRMGRVGLLLPELDAAARATLAAVVRRAFDGFVTSGAAHFNAACWLVRARAAPVGH